MVYKKIMTVGITLLSSYMLGACSSGTSYMQARISEPASVQPEIAFIAEKGTTLPPYGYVQFCRDNPAECPEQYVKQPQTSVLSTEVTATTAGIEPLNPFNLSQNLHRLLNNNPQDRQRFDNVVSLLDNVNREVNNSVIQVTDIEGFGVVENWRIPEINRFNSDIGDCEDFALAKRKILMDRYGFNRNALSISVLRRPQGDIHAVLMVRTSYGDYVLDNLERDVLPWHQTGYQWLKKQSFGNPSKWISL